MDGDILPHKTPSQSKPDILYECLFLCVPVTPVLSAAAREMDPCSNTTMSEMQLNSADEIQPVHILCV